MILVDANLLIYAVNRDAPQHARARRWLEQVLGGNEAVGFAWVVILAFLRVTTRPGIFATPLDAERALALVDEWLSLRIAQAVSPGARHWSVLRNLLETSGTLGNLTSDAHLAAIALETGATVYSADYDFRRFAGVRHRNPLE